MRHYIILFVLFLLVQSNAVIKIISKIDKTTNGDGLNTYGIILQGVLLVLAYIFIEMLVNNEYL